MITTCMAAIDNDCGPNSDHWSDSDNLCNMVPFLVPFWLMFGILTNWYSCLARSENFDGLCLTGAEIFAFENCLENHTNVEEKMSVLTCWNQHYQIYEASENWIFVFKVGAILPKKLNANILAQSVDCIEKNKHPALRRCSLLTVQYIPWQQKTKN